VGSVLIEHWLGAGSRIEVRDQASVSEVREAVRAVARGTDLATTRIEQLVAAASELAHNQLAHAPGGGAVVVRAIERTGVAGVEVIAADRGSGIADPTAALEGSPRSLGSLGVGMAAAARQSDEMDIDIRYGAGSCVAIRTFAAAVRKSEVGILARAHPDETVIGDHAVVWRDAQHTTIAVCDGLGHGVAARAASDRALRPISDHPDRSPAELLAEADAALRGSRGAVMAIARIDRQGAIEHVGVGNITSKVFLVDGTTRSFVSASGTLGIAMPRRLHVEHASLAPGEVLALASDGLTAKLELADRPLIVRKHPVLVGQALMSRYCRGTDDALIAVVRA